MIERVLAHQTVVFQEKAGWDSESLVITSIYLRDG